jgi:hypothetical protein
LKKTKIFEKIDNHRDLRAKIKNRPHAHNGSDSELSKELQFAFIRSILGYLKVLVRF